MIILNGVKYATSNKELINSLFNKKGTLNKPPKLFKIGKITVYSNDSQLNFKIAKAATEQMIYWSDGRMQHYFFDFKVGKYWVESLKINNELTEIKVGVFDPANL